MILVNYHLLAILPTVLFSLGAAIRFISLQKTMETEASDALSERMKEQFLFAFIMEATVLAAVNGIILAQLSGNFAAGTVFILFGLFLGIMIMSLLRNGYQDLSEYLIALMGLLFFYEFIYFLVAGTYFRLFGSIMIGWQIAVAWFLGIIGASVALFIVIVMLRMRASSEE